MTARQVTHTTPGRGAHVTCGRRAPSTCNGRRHATPVRGHGSVRHPHKSGEETDRTLSWLQASAPGHVCGRVCTRSHVCRVSTCISELCLCGHTCAVCVRVVSGYVSMRDRVSVCPCALCLSVCALCMQGVWGCLCVPASVSPLEVRSAGHFKQRPVSPGHCGAACLKPQVPREVCQQHRSKSSHEHPAE